MTSGEIQAAQKEENQNLPVWANFKTRIFAPTSKKPKRSIFSGWAKERQIQYPLDFPDLANGPKPQQQDVKDENAKTDPGFILLEKLPETLQG